MRQRLFAEDGNIDFVSAVRLATSLEAAERDAAAVEAGSGSEVLENAKVHKISAQVAARGQSVRGSGGRHTRPGRGGAVWKGAHKVAVVETQLPNRVNNDSCKGCGSTSHLYEGCRFRYFVCSRCKNAGHLRRMCPKAARGSVRGEYYSDRKFHYGEVDVSDRSSEEVEDASMDLHHLNLRDYKAVSYPISLDGEVINMEIDTGTAISCISKNTYDEHFRHRPIRPYNLCLKFIDGSKIQPLGVIKPLVTHGSITKNLELFIISGGTASLLGRQWLAELRISVPELKTNIVKRRNIITSRNDSSSVFHNKSVKLNNKIEILLDRYKNLFDGSLGKFTGGKATLRVREGAAPVFHRARPLPFALRERVDAEIDAMLRDGIIEPVDCSEWASPLVPVNKSDGALRVCVDYKTTVNPVLLVDRYPLPRIDDVLVVLNGSQYFSKIDLSQSYNQIELDDSKKYTVINTHRGLFIYNRLVFGLSSSPGIFQRIMTNLLTGIPNVAVFIDDVIIGGQTELEHLEALEMVFKRLFRQWLKIKKIEMRFYSSGGIVFRIYNFKGWYKGRPRENRSDRKNS
ncbi:hypothetical protein O3G_MSEX000260 [Manduca sexta]|nr:hypothetical protein O3G_MSEX000260 [Manduca sexta]